MTVTSQEQGGEGRDEVEGEGKEMIMELLWRSYPGVEPGGGRRLPGVHYHTSGNEGGVLRLRGGTIPNFFRGWWF